MIRITGHSRKNPHIIKWDCFTFPGGEIQVKLDTETPRPVFKKIIVEVELTDANEYMKLALLNDALGAEFTFDIPYVLKIGYFPYARQDRVCNKGEALAAFVMCDLINTLAFDEVVVLDPHSSYIEEHLENITVRQPSDIIIRDKVLADSIRGGDVTLVAPDKGATERVKELADSLGVGFIQAHKIRDLKTGKLSGFSYEGDVSCLDVLIVDDICDGGGTFCGLASELIEGGVGEIDLYVSHGIFSKGIDVLFSGGISRIYTTNSIPHPGFMSPKFKVLNWN